MARYGPILNHDFREDLVILHVFFATLLPNYWLAETQQALVMMRLGRQSPERERINEINGTF
jgi:hypothetical protein